MNQHDDSAATAEQGDDSNWGMIPLGMTLVVCILFPRFLVRCLVTLFYSSSRPQVDGKTTDTQEDENQGTIRTTIQITTGTTTEGAENSVIGDPGLTTATTETSSPPPTTTSTSKENTNNSTQQQQERQEQQQQQQRWRCVCETGFLPPGMFGGAEAVFRMGAGQCYHKKAA